MSNKLVLEMRGIDKAFGSVKVLDNVHLTLSKGEVLGFIGENGAGKSTLMKILSGAYIKDAGEIFIDGKKVKLDSIQNSQANGISIIYQELSLINTLNVTENIFIGREKTNEKACGFGLLKRKEMEAEARELMVSLGVDIDVRTCVSDLNLAQRQMVEIARCLSVDAKIIIMDEPTAALENKERDLLFSIIHKLKEKGVSIIFVSHALEELMLICDKVLVIRDGQIVKEVNTEDVSVDEIITLMIGKQLKEQYIKRSVEIGENVLEVSELSDGKNYSDVSFNVRKGEIVGFAGLEGCGKQEVVRTLFGLRHPTNGEIIFNGEKILIRTPNFAIEKKIAFLSNDRKTEGILANQDVKWNITIANIDKILDAKILKTRKEKVFAEDYVQSLSIKTKGLTQEIHELSGGNQQKVLVARWLFADSQLIIMEEPTRGIDVNAKTEIYEYIIRCVEMGKSIIIVSSETSELIGICDRIYVMNKGKVVAELMANETNQNEIKHYAVNL